MYIADEVVVKVKGKKNLVLGGQRIKKNQVQNCWETHKKEKTLLGCLHFFDKIRKKMGVKQALVISANLFNGVPIAL